MSGQFFMGLGHEDAAGLRSPLRASHDGSPEQAIEEAISRKPKGADLIIDRRHNHPAVGRHMSMTGGGHLAQVNEARERLFD
jgi:cyclic pyranopterin phosphate synthase